VNRIFPLMVLWIHTKMGRNLSYISLQQDKGVQLRKRKTYDDNFKAVVALQAIKGERMISEIATQFGVNPNQIIKWKKLLLENVSSLFSKKKDPEIKD